MSVARAVLLGAVQGVTEFFPVSSDGHLALFQAVLAPADASLAFDVALHAGTLGSMLVFFRRDLARLVKGLFDAAAPDAAEQRRRVLFIALATVPTGVVGLALKGTVEGLVASYAAAGAGFLVSAAFLAAGTWAFRRADKDFSVVPWWHMLVLGVVQGAAVWPGWSRSGSTIATALLLGWRWEEAGRFSFVLAIPAIAGAMLLESRAIAGLDPVPALAGGITAFFVGCLALSGLMKFLAARRLWPFAAYCAALGLFALWRAG